MRPKAPTNSQQTVVPGEAAGRGKGIQGPKGPIHGPWIPFPSLSLAGLASSAAGDDRSSFTIIFTSMSPNQEPQP